MKLEQLRQIIAIEKYKSISKAAKELYMGQPALSSSVNKLEKKIGVQIFQRTPQGVVPTQDGKKILEMARQVVNESNAIMEYSKRNDPEQLTGIIKISLAPAYSYLYFDIMTRFKEQFPMAELQIGIHPHESVREMVRSGEYSLAIDFVPANIIEEEKLSTISLKEHTIQLFAGPFSRFYDRDSVDIEELRDEKFIAFSSVYWKQNNRNLKVRTTPVFIEDNASIRHILRRSDMIAAMPDMYDKLDVENYEGRPRMIPITGIDKPSFHGTLVYSGKRRLTLLEQHTIRFLKVLMEELE